MVRGRSAGLGFAVALALSTAVGFAENPPAETLPQLEKRLESATDSDRIALLNRIAGMVVRQDGPRAKALATEALALAEHLGDRPGEALAQKNLALSFLVLESAAEGLPHIQRAHELYVALGDRQAEAATLGYTGMLLSATGKTWSAISTIRQALSLYTELGDTKGMAAATNNLAAELTQVGELDEALRFALESLRLEESLGRKIGIANDLNSIGNIYFELGDYLKARDFYERALPRFAELGEKPGEARVINNLGNIDEKLGRDDRARHAYERALAMGLALASRSIETDARNNLGIVFKKQQRYADAIAQYRAVLRLRQANGDLAGLPSTYHNLAEACLLQGRPREALAHLEEGKKAAAELKSNEPLESIHRLSAEAYAALGDWKNAYESEVRYGEVRSALLDAQRSRKIAELQEKYDAEGRAKQIALLAKDNELLKKDGEIRRLALARSRLVTGILVTLSALVVVATLLLFRRYLYLLAFWKKRSFVGQYRIDAEITSGGMGVVYRATSLLEPDRPVALKVIREELAADERQRQRFINEGRIIDALDHPGIVKVLDRGEHAGRLYLAMELLTGKTLAAWIAEAAAAGRPIELRRGLALLRQLVEAVAAIHARGVIHRDISPANVLVVECDGAEQAKLLDFGLAKADTGRTLTEAGELLGTLTGLAPERIQLRDLTPASDTFSLGVLAYELLTLKRPFSAEEPAELLRQLLSLDPVPPQRLRPEIGAELSALVMAMLAKEPRDRPDDEQLLHRFARAGESA
ncbi:MAG: tetratricopeptide repeat protein [Holophagales bacterium]|nr:MAG: tetratricopeptide repeat protein [Holophagales bacterium]